MLGLSEALHLHAQARGEAGLAGGEHQGVALRVQAQPLVAQPLGAQPRLAQQHRLARPAGSSALQRSDNAVTMCVCRTDAPARWQRHCTAVLQLQGRCDMRQRPRPACSCALPAHSVQRREICCWPVTSQPTAPQQQAGAPAAAARARPWRRIGVFKAQTAPASAAYMPLHLAERCFGKRSSRGSCYSRASGLTTETSVSVSGVCRISLLQRVGKLCQRSVAHASKERCKSVCSRPNMRLCTRAERCTCLQWNRHRSGQPASFYALFCILKYNSC